MEVADIERVKRLKGEGLRRLLSVAMRQSAPQDAIEAIQAQIDGLDGLVAYFLEMDEPERGMALRQLEQSALVEGAFVAGCLGGKHEPLMADKAFLPIRTAEGERLMPIMVCQVCKGIYLTDIPKAEEV